MTISIIVPVLNEAAQIRPFLRHLQARAPDAEVIVVDGGSNDGTAALAGGLCDSVIATPRGRPTQMNAGAGIAKGNILWFLHADNEVPADCISAITTAMNGQRFVGGCFRVRIPRPEWIYRIHDGLAHYVGRLLRIRCGDHGIFVRRDVFQQVGGYPDVPLMEDVELFRAIHSHGRAAWLSERLLLSCRRHVQVGVYRYTVVCAVIVALYCFGVTPRFLFRLYSLLVPSRQFRPLRPVEDQLFADFRLDATTVTFRNPHSAIRNQTSTPATKS